MIEVFDVGFKILVVREIMQYDLRLLLYYYSVSRWLNNKLRLRRVLWGDGALLVDVKGVAGAL